VSGSDPTQHVYWLASRALGVVAVVLLSLSVALGLALASKSVKRPGAPAWLKHLHEAISLSALAAIVSHGLILLGDGYLDPGLNGVLLPFQMASQPLWTALGIIAGWASVIIGLSFYVRRWIGVAAWRWLHRWTFAVYLLSVVHVLGSGTDAGSGWLRAIMLVSSAPVVYFATLRLLPKSAPAPRERRPRADRALTGMPAPPVG
jgi:sulfoxide reductase heme-binding subunit YedZ